MSRKSPQKQPDKPSIVGPSYVQVLENANFLGKEVSLILCGESHEDAIDVTRQGGIFEAREGWVELAADAHNWSACRVVAKKSQLPLERCKEWAGRRVENDDEVYDRIALLWAQEGQQRKKPKGFGFLLELATDVDDIDSDDEDDWITMENGIDILTSVMLSEESLITPSTQRIFEWVDLDPVAHALNRRRLSDEEVSTDELDAIVNMRKAELRAKSNIWTWDDWFHHLQQTTNHKESDLHLILEGPIPPWELQLHRPTHVEDLPQAPEYIRCIPEDEESDDEGDPSNDGAGAYLDYVYRRFRDNEVLGGERDWLHCVDVRDMGCETAPETKNTKEQWTSLLRENELESLRDKTSYRPLELDNETGHVKFASSRTMNFEQKYCEELQSNRMLDMSDEEGEDSNDVNEFTIPSFEAFFGQAAEHLYYAPHVRLAYSPFLAKCVRSLPRWENFFSELFLGGTIQKAMSGLALEGNKDATFVRSQIMKVRTLDTTAESYEIKLRDESKYAITNPFFPFIFYLTAPTTGTLLTERTWSSQLFVNSFESQQDDRKEVALIMRQWILDKIQHQSNDPKRCDDSDCGGEWFEAFLRATHREIYDDIDRSDCTELLWKTHMESEANHRKKYNIGRITIPNMTDAFAEIVDRFQLETQCAPSDIITPRVECLSKILIDIWMSNLVDFSVLLKIAEVIAEAKSEKVVVVCYLGSAHTRALADCFVDKMAFQAKTFVGKVDWQEGERRTLQLPLSLWKVGK